MLKPKILHLRSSRSLAGPERHLLELLPGLEERGYGVEVALLYRRRPGDPPCHPLLGELAALGIPGFQFDDPERSGRSARRALAERLRLGDVAALHGHDPKADWVIARSTAARKRLATLHLHTRETLPLRLYRRLDLALVRRFDGVIAVSAAQASEVAAGTGAAAGRARCRVIANGIDARRLRARAEAALPGVRRELAHEGALGAAPLLIAAGRLTRQKGIDLLLDAMPAILAAHAGARLWIAGEGPEHAALSARAERLRLGGRVRFLGERGDLAALLAAADLFVLPSRSEGSPYVLLEAIALGLPVVTTAVGDVAATLGVASAALVPPGDAAALAAAIRLHLEAPAEARRGAALACDRLPATRTAAAMAEATAAFYGEVLA